MPAVSEYASPEELRTRITELEALVAQLQEENERLRTPPAPRPTRTTKR